MFVAVLVVGVCAGAWAGVPSGELLLSVQVEEIAVSRGADGTAVFTGLPAGGHSGQPELPVQRMRILLPPEADVRTVTVSLLNKVIEVLPGEWEVAPAPPMYSPSRGIVWPPDAKILDGRDMHVYGADAFFPASHAGAPAAGMLRQWKLAEVTIFPVRYNPVTRQLAQLKSGDLLVRFAMLDAGGVAAHMTAVGTDAGEERRMEIVREAVNFKGVEQAYETAIRSLASTRSGTTDYVIITTSDIVSQSTNLNTFIDHKQMLGFSVAVITEGATANATNYLAGTNANSRADNIRSWLVNNYATKGIEYVLLVGNPHPTHFDSAYSVPMKLILPRGEPDPDKLTPTDMYFADLSHPWDGSAGPDNFCEVSVGRFPVYNTGSQQIGFLDSMLAKTLAYEYSKSREWRTNFLGSAGFQDNGFIVDGAELIEAFKQYVCAPRGWGSRVLYQQGSKHSSCDSKYASDFELRGRDNGVDENYHDYHWSNGQYSVVMWWGHGNWAGTAVGPNNQQDGIKFYQNYASRLNDNYPSFLFPVSCLNGEPEFENNLCTAVLRHGVIGTLAPSRVTWFLASVWNTNRFKSNLQNADINYYTARSMLVHSNAIGDALNWTRANIISSAWKTHNDLAFNLYGDPSVGLFTGGTNLEPPTGVLARDGTSINHCQVSWNPVTGASHFRVYRATSADGEKTAISSWQTPLAYDDTTALPGVLYYYWVRAARDASGTDLSMFSAPDTGWRALTPPTAVTASDGTSTNHCQVLWNPVTGASHFQVSRSATADGVKIPISGWQTPLGFNDTTATPGVTYYYWVRAAVDGSGAQPSDYSEPDTGWRNYPVLPAPQNLTASTTYTDSVQLSWGAAPPATHYRVSRANSPEGTKTTLSTWQSGTNFSDYTATPGVHHYYWVQAAHDADGTGASEFGYSGTFGHRQVTVPTGVAASDGTSTDGVQVTWNAVAGSPTYLVSRSANPDGVKIALGSTWQTETDFFDDIAVTPGVTFYYWVQAASQDGSFETDYSTPTTGWRKLSPPAEVTASEGEHQGFTHVYWGSSHGATHYRLRRSLSEGGARTALTEWITSTSFNDETGTPGTDYYYWVQAATDASGARPSDETAFGIGWSALARPTGVSASDGSVANHVNITWNPVEGASRYRVSRSDTEGGAKTVLSGWLANTHYNDPTGVLLQPYYYWVQAATSTEGDRMTDYSDPDTGWRAIASPVPTATEGMFPGYVTVLWDSPGDSLYYLVSRAESPEGAKTELSSWQTGSFYTDTTTVFGVTYYYWVRAASDASGANASPYGDHAAGWCLLSIPENIAATKGEHTDRVIVTWDAARDATHYLVARSTVLDGEKTDLGTWQEDTTFEDTSAEPGIVYFYHVRAATDDAGANASGYSFFSAGWRALDAPTGVMASYGTSDQYVLISWNAPPGATGYRVYRADVYEGPYEAISGWISDSSFEDWTLAPEVDYYYRVQAAAGPDEHRIESPLSNHNIGRISLSLRNSLNTYDRMWDTGGHSSWFGQSAVNHDGHAAAQSGDMIYPYDTWLETWAEGPARIHFWWKVSTEQDGGRLELRLNDEVVASITSETDWQRVTIPLPEDEGYFIRFRYFHEHESVLHQDDAAWVDEFFYEDLRTTDGILNSWWDKYGVMHDVRIADLDLDYDGFTNWQEYVADTDPNDPDSFFRPIVPERGAHPTIHFESSSNRVYTLRGLTNLLHGAWGTVPGAGPRLGVGGPDFLQDTNEPPLGPYYRLKVELP